MDNSNFLNPSARGPRTPEQIMADGIRRASRDKLCAAVDDAMASGLTDADLIDCMTVGRGDLDPGAVTLRLIGTLTRYIGSTLTCILVLVSGYLFVSKVARGGAQLWVKAKAWAKTAFPFLSFVADVVTDEEQDAESVAAMALQTAFLSGLPFAVREALPTLASSITESFVPEPVARPAVSTAVRAAAGGAVSAINPALGAVLTNPIVNQGGGGGVGNALLKAGIDSLSSVAQKVIGSIFGDYDGEITAAEVARAAEELGMDPAKLERLVAAS